MCTNACSIRSFLLQYGALGHPMLMIEHGERARCVISNRNHRFEIMRRAKECVIGVPTVELAGKVVKCRNDSGRTVNKFEAYGLTPMPASLVEASSWWKDYQAAIQNEMTIHFAGTSRGARTG